MVGTLRLGSGNTTDDETAKIINIFPSQKIIRVFRNAGIAHSFGSNVDILNTVISIPVKTTKFNSQLNDVVFFNAPQQIGLGTDGVGISTNYFFGDNK
ncbi:MAG: hypothetical protein CM15mP113_0740 [Pseudomonadota bacterium]|nr:MAG: hypothetical protein CM15mP113_0740 [Pseudomonadota bacterium]